MRKLGWCPFLHPSEAGAHQYDHALEKWDLPTHARLPIQYAIRHVNGLAWHPPKSVQDKQEECTCNVKWDVYQSYRRYWIDDRNVVAFKGTTLECDFLTEWNIPWLDLEELGCPKFKGMMRLGTIESCGYHQDPWRHRSAHVKCYHFANWVHTRLGLGQNLNVVNFERTLRFLRL